MVKLFLYFLCVSLGVQLHQEKTIMCIGLLSNQSIYSSIRHWIQFPDYILFQLKAFLYLSLLIQKKYLAILEGNLQENQIWEDKIEKNNTRTDKTWVRGEKSGKFHTVTVNSTGGKIAHTEVFPICHDIFDGREITLAEVIIKTGRTHQIRSQSAYHGFPLLGDSAYGSKKIDSKRVGRDFFLHAAELTFPKPNPLGLPEKLIAPPPPFFKELFPEFSLSFR